ncbi:MAG: RES family NAD+ phosphorylase [Pseudomonadota bacterium]|nr:RES family NAD+ phosphorylase [Pseudomonadota bacterium]
MRLWRIAQPKYALDKLCAGTARYGGRWNPVGIPALYCGSSISLCSLEKFVNIGATPFPPLVLVAVDIPDDSALYSPTVAELPIGWNTMPTSAAAQKFGGAWLSRASELGMIVPSAIVPEETNMVINTRHPGYMDVALTLVRSFTFDGRMFK